MISLHTSRINNANLPSQILTRIHSPSVSCPFDGTPGSLKYTSVKFWTELQTLVASSTFNMSWQETYKGSNNSAPPKTWNAQSFPRHLHRCPMTTPHSRFIHPRQLICTRQQPQRTKSPTRYKELICSPTITYKWKCGSVKLYVYLFFTFQHKK